MGRLTRLVWIVLVVNLAVILLGAVVRATGSGAGCGRSWPTCQGEVVPALEGATAVEFSHRVVSGAALVLLAALVVAVFRRFPAGHPARLGAALSGLAMAGEALIGAAIVLFEWVADDASAARVVAVPLHLVNTLLLLAAVTLTGYWASGGGRLRWSGPAKALVWVAAGMLLIGATGAVTALADTLFPKTGAADIAEVHLLTRLRVIHPIVAVGIGLAAAAWASRRAVPIGGSPERWGRAVVVLVGAEVAAGVLNVALRTPLWMQVVHLLLADLVWIAWVMLGAVMLGGEPDREQVPGSTGLQVPYPAPGRD